MSSMMNEGAGSRCGICRRTIRGTDIVRGTSGKPKAICRTCDTMSPKERVKRRRASRDGFVGWSRKRRYQHLTKNEAKIAGARDFSNLVPVVIVDRELHRGEIAAALVDFKAAGSRVQKLSESGPFRRGAITRSKRRRSRKGARK